jgi:hypothetical protein
MGELFETDKKNRCPGTAIEYLYVENNSKQHLLTADARTPPGVRVNSPVTGAG